MELPLPFLTAALCCLLSPLCSKMGMNDKLFFTNLELPEGARLHHSVNPALPILKIAK